MCVHTNSPNKCSINKQGNTFGSCSLLCVCLRISMYLRDRNIILKYSLHEVLFISAYSVWLCTGLQITYIAKFKQRKVLELSITAQTLLALAVD